MAPRTVLITGASTGIGRATAVRLANAGWDVFAGVRKVEDAESVRAESPDRIHPVILDVTDPATIEAAAATVREQVGSHGLTGLVNNAGISLAGPLEFLPLDELRRQLEVNVVGQVAVTQAVMPEIRTATGRIVNVGSIGGRIARPLLGPYNASKFAITAISESLRKELRPWGIHVVVVEPGSVKTEIWDKGEQGIDGIAAAIGPRGMELYGELIERIRNVARKTGERGVSADAAAEVIETALTSDRPRSRYLVGIDAKGQAAFRRFLPDRVFDAVEGKVIEKQGAPD